MDDVLGGFEFLFPKTEIQSERALPEGLTPEEVSILQVLGNDELHLDVLIRKTELASATVSSSLLRLELKRLVRQLPGKFFVKTH